MISQFVAEINTNSKARAVLRGQPIARVDLASLLRQIYARVDDDALRVDLGDLLVLDADKLRQTIAIDLEAATIPDDKPPATSASGACREVSMARCTTGTHDTVVPGSTGCVGSVRRRAKRAGSLSYWLF